MNICFWMPVLTQATSRKIDLTQASGVATPTSTDYINFPLQTSLQESNLELDPTDQLRGGKQTLPLSFWFSYVLKFLGEEMCLELVWDPIC